MQRAERPNPVAAVLPTLLPEWVPSFLARSMMIPVVGSLCSQKYRTQRRAKSSRNWRSSGLTGEEVSGGAAANARPASMPTPAAESKNSRRKKSEFFSLGAIYELQCRPGGINPKKCDATQDPSGSRLAASRISMRGGFQSQALKAKASLQLNNS